MGTVSTTLPSDGQTIDAADVNTPINAILSEFNGNIDNDNIKSTAAIAGSKLADASITNAKLSTTAGELGGAWTDYTPTLSNMSGGTLGYAKYTQIGKTVHARFRYTLGGAGVSGVIGVTLPVTAISDGNFIASRHVQMIDANTGTRVFGIALFATTTRLDIFADTASTAYSGITSTSSTVPFTWAASDTIEFAITYQAA